MTPSTETGLKEAPGVGEPLPTPGAFPCIHNK